MNKQQVKQIQITEVKVNHLSNNQDITGEYNTSANIDFLLSETCSFKVFDQELTIDRVKMGTDWDSAVTLSYANEKDYFGDVPMSKSIIHKVYDRIREEQNDGCSKGWCFDDDVLEMLRGEREINSRW